MARDVKAELEAALPALVERGDMARAQEVAKALMAMPESTAGQMGAMQLSLERGNWADYDRRTKRLARMVREARAPVWGASTGMLIWDDPELLARCAKLEIMHSPAPPLPLPMDRKSKVRIAYVSADFRTHATSILISGVFEAHDRERFEVVAVSLAPDDGSPARARIVQAVDVFIDAHDRSGQDISRLLREARIDIAVDLMGYTAAAKPEIFANRAAPIQMNYLGYPNTSSAPWMDYLIVDPFIATEEFRACASEKVVVLPDCYQCNDGKRAIAEIPTRSDVGLPEGAFVFACLSRASKINPPVFDVWMQILKRAEGSVLWLLEDSRESDQNLRLEAKRRRIDPARLIFADRRPSEQHLARLALADLNLDTFPYGSHTTGSDALWAGTPILTRAGRSFASRVCGSLLTTIGVPELIAKDWRQYEATALRLYSDPEALRAIRVRVAEGRKSSALFDTERFCRNLERALETMIAFRA